MPSIIFLTTESLTESSSIGRYHPLGKELATRGWDVKFLMLHNDYYQINEKHCFVDGIDVHYVGPRHVRYEGDVKVRLSGTDLLVSCARAVWGFIRAGMRGRRGVVYACKPLPQNALAALILSNLRRLPFVMDVDDYEVESTRFQNRLQKRLCRISEDDLPRRCALLTLNTQFSVGRYEKLGYNPDRLLYLPNGVDPGRFESIRGDQVELLRRRHFPNGDERVILYFGALDIASGHAVDHLVSAFPRVLAKCPTARLAFLGRGHDKMLIQALARSKQVLSNVVFLDRVPAAEVPAYIAMADVTVDPGTESLAYLGRSPLKILESMAAGTPVVAADLGDRPLYLDHGRAGILVRGGDEESLANGILRLLLDEGYTRTIREHAATFIRNYYWPKLADRFVEKVEALGRAL
jgi:glycosyltransferase involved in cell wall biosynthesis